MKNLYLLLVLVITQTFLFAECLDGPDFDCDGICDASDDTVGGVITLSFSNATETTIDIDYDLSSCQGISGFQFTVDGVELISATDGNLTVQSANNNVIAFDLAGAQLDPGLGSLASLLFFADLDGATIGLSNVVIGSSGAEEITTDGPGSADIAACTNFDGDDLCDIDADECVSDDCGICDGGNASNDCNDDCSGSLSAGTWVNTNPGGAVDPSAPTTVYGSADDGSWNLSPCVWLESPSTVDNGNGTVTITSLYGSDAGHACELSSGVFNGEVSTTNVSTHNLPDYAIVGEVEFTLASANSSNFSVTSTGTFDELGLDYSLNGSLAGGSSGGAVVDMCDTCDDDASNDCVQDCAGTWGGSEVLSGCDNTCSSTLELDECGICDGGNDSFDCNDDCSGSLSAGTWTNTNPGGAVDPSAPTTVYGSADDGSWNLSPCVWLDSPSTVDNSDGTVTITSVYGADADHGCELSSGVFNGEVITTNISTHDVALGYAIVGDVAFTLASANSSNFSVTSTGTFDNIGADYSLNGSLAGGSSGGAVVDDCDDCVDPDDFNGTQDCAGVCDGTSVVDDCGICDNDDLNDCIDFTPSLTIDFATPYVDSLSAITATVSQNIYEPEAFSSTLITDGGSFEFYDLSEGDTLGTGSINYDGWINVSYHIEVYNIISSAELEAVLVLDSEFDENFGVGSAIGGYTLENTAGGTRLYTQNTAVSNLLTDGYTLSFTLNNIFRCPSTPGDITSTASFTSNEDNYGTVHEHEVVIVKSISHADPIADVSNSETDYTVPHNGNPYDNTVNVVLDGSASVGDGLVCQWGLDSRQEGCVVELILIPGTYTFCLTVTDQYGVVDNECFTLTVNPEVNVAPVVDAGADTSYAIAHDGDPETDCVTFDLTGSAVDEEGDELVCEWTDSTDNPLSETTVTECGVDGFAYTLTCTDSYGANNSATVTISIEDEPNFAPTADAGEDASYTIDHDGHPETDCVTFDLTGSASDIEGDLLSYNWNGNDGDLCLTENCDSLIACGTGDYTYTLTTTDSYNAFHTDTVVVTVVVEPNASPVSNDVSYVDNIPHNGDPDANSADYPLCGDGSDEDGDPIIYTWANDSTGICQTFELSEGEYTFDYYVTDSYGAESDTSTVSITLSELNEGPTACAGDEQELTLDHDGQPGGSMDVSLSGDCSSDPESDSLSYFWCLDQTVLSYEPICDFVGDSSNVTIALEPGEYDFALTVTDPYDESDIDSVHVIIKDEENPTPTAYAGADTSYTIAHDDDPNTDAITFTLTGLCSDEDGDSLSYSWTDSDGNVLCDTSDCDVPENGAADYTYTLTCADLYGASERASGSDNITVTVNEEPNQNPIAEAGDFQEHAIDHDGDPLTNSKPIILDGSESADADGDSLSYSWTDSGGNIVGEGATYSDSLTVGIYTYTLCVEDSYNDDDNISRDCDDVSLHILEEPNEDPTADAGEDASYEIDHDGVLGGSKEVSFTGVCEDADSDNTIAAYSIGEEAISNPHTLEVGEHTITLTCTDSYGASVSDDLVVTVFEENTDPVAAATDFNAQLTHDGQPGIGCKDVVLDCSASSDPDSLDVLSYLWEPVTRDGDAATLDVCLEEGEHNFICTVTDPYGASDSDTSTVVIEPEDNADPVAALSCTDSQAYHTDPGDGNGSGPDTDVATVTCSADSTTDSDEEDVLQYNFIQISGSDVDFEVSEDGNSFEFVSVAGDYGFQVTVADPYGATSSAGDVATIAIAENGTLTTDAGADTSYTIAHDGNPGTDSITFTLSGLADDHEGDALSCQWSDSDGPLLDSDGEPCDTFDCGVKEFGAADYNYTFTCTDPYELSSSSTVTVTVEPELNEAPTADAGADTSYVIEHDGVLGGSLSVIFNGGECADADTTDTLQATWSMSGDSLTVGIHTVTLTCTDPYGATDSDDVVVTVEQEPNEAPVADAGEDASYAIPHDGDPDTDSITFTLTGSGSDSDGDALSYSWTDSEGCITDTCGVTENGAATYSYTLSVTDPYDATASDDVEVTVAPEPNEPPEIDCDSLIVILPLPHDGVPGGCMDVELGGCTAFDPDGDDLEYDLSADNGFSENSDESSITAAFCEGSYTITVCVTDPYGETACDSYSLNVLPEENHAPVVSCADFAETLATDCEPGGSTDVDLGSACSFSDEDDSDGFELQFSSCDLNGPAIIDQYTDSAAANGLEEGQYCFTLRVTDNLGGFDEDSFNVTINQEDHGQPSVDAGDDQTLELIHDGDPSTDTAYDIELCSVGSHDPFDCELTYEWSNGSAEACTVDDFSIDDEPTCLTVTVTDTYGQESSDEVCITVEEHNQDPIANFTFEVEDLVIEHNGIPNEGSTVVTLNGCGSDDPDNTIIDNPVDDIEFQWFIDGDAIDDATSCIYDTEPLEAGTHSYTLRVTDAYGAYDEFTGGFTTSEANDAPVANAGSDTTYVLPHDCVQHDGILTVILDGLESSDPDGDIIADWDWYNCGDPIILCDDIDELCVFEIGEGDHCFSLNITDIYGDSSSDTMMVTITEPNTAPTVDAGQNQTINEGETFILDATASFDPEGCDLTYAWTCDGYSDFDATGSYIEITSDEEANNPGGEYSCEVCVNDGYDYDNSDDGTSTSCTSIDITVDNKNIAPVAEAGPGLIEYQIPHDGVSGGSYSMNLDCSQSSDFDIDDLAYTWSDESGNTVCTTSDCNLDLDSGTYEFSCSVDDGNGGSHSDNIYVVINDEQNNDPTAEIDGENLQISNEFDPVSLNGCNSSDDDQHEVITYGSYYDDLISATGDTDADFLSFSWIRTALENPEEESYDIPSSGNVCDLSFDAPEFETNTYVIVNYELHVEDTYVLGDTQNATRVIMNVNGSPGEMGGGRDGDNEFVINPEHDCDPETFYADISLSEIYTDPDKDALEFKWYNNGELVCDELVAFNENGMNTACTIEFDAPGEYDIELAVKDDFPQGDYYDEPITVIENYTITVNSEIGTNNPPEADAGQAQEIKLAHDCVTDNGIEVNLDASASSDDIDDELLTYKWTLEGEVICDSDSPECTTDELLSGEHEFTLEVCDCYDACATDQVIVSVEYEDNIEPTISVENDHIEAVIPHDGIPESNCFEISTEAYGEDTDGDALTYVWTNLLDDSIESNTSQLVKEFCEEGSYEFEITVTDCYDASSTQLITIEVLPEANVAPIIFSMQLIFEACKEDSSSDLCDFVVSCNPGQQILVNGLNLVCDEDNGADCSVPDYAYSGNSTDQIECTWSTPEGVVEGCEIAIDCPEKDVLWNEFTMSDEELLDASYISGYQLSVTDPYQAYDGNSTESDESVVIASPYLLDQISLRKNVNLISFNWLPDYTATLDTHPDCVHEDCNGILSNVQGLGVCEVNAIITAGSASTYLNGQWMGSIVEISDENGYWVIYADYQDCDVSIDVIGIETDCEETVYDIIETALISYVGPNNSPIEDAIHCDEESCIKSFTSNSTAAFCGEEGWVGSLGTMELGKGYWILKKEACEDVEFSWENCEDDADDLARTNEKNHISLSENLTFVNTTSQAFYFINEMTLDGVSLSEDKDWYILAYSNETIVGARKWSGFGTDLPVMGYDKLIESSANYPKTGDIISIKLYNNTTGEIINMAFNGNSYPYASNQVYVISSVASAISSPDNFALGSSYPNPFNPLTTINFALPFDTELSIKIYNLEGRLVEVLTDQNMKAGYHSVIWDASKNSSGVYFIRMQSGEFKSMQKLMLVK